MTTDTHSSRIDTPQDNAPSLTALTESLSHVMLRDQERLSRRVAGLRRRQREKKPIDRGLNEVEREVDKAKQLLAQREALRVTLDYPAELPVVERREDILTLQGPQVMKGYWQREEETRNAIDENGWFHTGDIAVLQDDGYIKIVDRKKDMILVSGFNVYPNEVEDVVAAHPDVLEAAAVGVADENAGEAIKLFVVSKNSQLDAETLRAWCKKELTAHKVPKYIEFRDELPLPAHRDVRLLRLQPR